MIRSMTAFASAETGTACGTLGCELRAVNHRFLELGVRLPEELRALEPQLRERVAARVSRGKLDLSLRLRAADGGEALQLNQPLLAQLAELSLDLDARFPRLRTDLGTLLQFPGLLQARAPDTAALHADALALLDRVLDEFVAMREREGARLGAAIAERNDAVARIAGEVRALVPAIRTGQRQKLEARLAELSQSGGLAAPEPNRVEQELVLWLQKLDVDEEIDRLGSHVEELRRVLQPSGGDATPVGRKLDFLLQEFNREANTLGSKSVDRRTSQAAVELKVLIDQIREQVQNIE